MKSKKLEGNIIIAINSLKKIMDIFLGPFLTAYFIKTSEESLKDISIYYIFSYIFLAIGSFIAASIIKRKFRIGMFRVGVILNFFYIMTIIILKSQIVNHLFLISILYGISAGCYWFPYNLFVINKVDNNIRTQYMVKSKIVSSIIGVACPLVLGSIITVTNYELTAVIILFISMLQIICSFILTPENGASLSKFDLKRTFKRLKSNDSIKKISIVEFFIGMNVSSGALSILIDAMIFLSFKSNFNLGIITSIATIISIIFVRIYGKIYKNKDDKNIILISSILPVLAVFMILFFKNNVTIIIFDIVFVIFTSLLSLAREIRLYNISDSSIVDKDIQCEFFSIREGILNFGRIVSYLILLFAGITGNEIILNIVLFLLSLSILIMGINIRKIDKFEK